MTFNDVKLNKNTTFFIHFDSKEICDKFCNKYKGRTGNRCCFGKGILLHDVTSYNEIYSIKNKFILESK